MLLCLIINILLLLACKFCFFILHGFVHLSHGFLKTSLSPRNSDKASTHHALSKPYILGFHWVVVVVELKMNVRQVN